MVIWCLKNFLGPFEKNFHVKNDAFSKFETIFWGILEMLPTALNKRYLWYRSWELYLKKYVSDSHNSFFCVRRLLMSFVKLNMFQFLSFWKFFYGTSNFKNPVRYQSHFWHHKYLIFTEYHFLKINKSCSHLSLNYFYVSCDTLSHTKSLLVL